MSATSKNLFFEQKYALAKNLFLKENLLYEAGFCALLEGDKKEAKGLWEQSDCTASLFGLKIIDVIDQKSTTLPGYFQTRAFLEVYLNLFLENGRIDWAEKVVGAHKFFEKSNPEAQKFIARVLFSNGYLDLTLQFAGFAKEICFQDPEIHVIEAQAHVGKSNYKEALESLDYAIEAAPEYFPALSMKKLILGSGLLNSSEIG